LDPIRCILSFGPDPVHPKQWRHAPLFTKLHPRKKQQRITFLSPAFQTQITAGFINNKLYFFHNQTYCMSVLNKTQTQPSKQTLPALSLLPFFFFPPPFLYLFLTTQIVKKAQTEHFLKIFFSFKKSK